MRNLRWWDLSQGDPHLHTLMACIIKSPIWPLFGQWGVDDQRLNLRLKVRAAICLEIMACK